MEQILEAGAIHDVPAWIDAWNKCKKGIYGQNKKRIPDGIRYDLKTDTAFDCFLESGVWATGEP